MKLAAVVRCSGFTLLMALTASQAFAMPFVVKKHPTLCDQVLRAGGEVVASNFTKASDGELIRAIDIAYPELRQLAGKVSATPESAAFVEQTRSPSEILFGAKHDEFNRTAVGILAAKWVLSNDYDTFTKPQNPAVKLARASFDELRVKLHRLDASELDALISYMVLNDLGKVEAIRDEVKKLTGINDADHDSILLEGVKRKPELFPSFVRLEESLRAKILAGLEAKGSFAQFGQGENTPAGLTETRKMDALTRELYVLHAQLDIAGAAGHGVYMGSAVLSESVYEGQKIAAGSLAHFDQGHDEVQVYKFYVGFRAALAGFEIDSPTKWAVARIAMMARATKKADWDLVSDVFMSLHRNERAILEAELAETGLDKRFSVMLEYSPAMINNAKLFFIEKKAENPLRSALEATLPAMSRLFVQTRQMLKGRAGTGQFTVNINEVARLAKTPLLLKEKDFEIKPGFKNAEVIVAEPSKAVDLSVFPPPMMSANEIPGNVFGVVAMGGGSDGIQAAIVGMLLKGSDKKVGCIMSVRTSKLTTVQGSKDVVGEARTIENHGGEVVPGVFRVRSDSTGSGRFLENIPADKFPVYLVLDELDGKLSERIQAALKDAGGVDTILAVDTGGDSYFPVKSEVDAGRSTPDQDLRVMLALNEIGGNTPIFTAGVAVGVDSPDNVADILKKARSQYLSLELDGWPETILAQYKEWRMDGTDDQRFGKTPLAWQLALNEKWGMQPLSLPQDRVLDRKNPWNMYVRINSAMQGIFISILHNHLVAIGAIPETQY